MDKKKDGLEDFNIDNLNDTSRRVVGNQDTEFGIIDSASMDHKTPKRRRARRGIKFDTKEIFTLSKLLKWGFFALIGLIILVPLLFLWYSRDLPTPGKLVVSKYKDATRIY